MFPNPLDGRTAPRTQFRIGGPLPEIEYDPDAGSVGYLTWDEWDRLTRAWTTAFKHLPWWWVAGHVRGGDSDELRSRATEHALPLPATWLAAHEITRLMQELNSWPDLQDAAHDKDGAELALLLLREVETAAAKWPLSDRTHRVQHFRCEACQQLTLKYYPPNLRPKADAPTTQVLARVGVKAADLRPIELLDAVVRCTAADCRAVMSSARFEIATKLIEWEHTQSEKRRMGADQGGTGTGGPVDRDGLSVAEGGEDSHDASGEGVVAVSA